MTAEQPELTETLVENFIATMRFIARNDLWEEGQRALDAAGIATITVSSEPIRVLRSMLVDDLIPHRRLHPDGQKNAEIIAECGCGVTMPGPGHQPEVPHTTVPDAGTEAGTGGN